MLSIAALTRGPSYYLELTNLNYYSAGGEPPPMWAGTAAKEFGLSGIADKKHVYKLCAGFHHETGKALVRNAGKETRNPGEDGTFSADKTVSLAWALGDDKMRKAIEKAQFSAVKQAIEYIEDKAGFARLGGGGQNLKRCPLLFALFEHGTSRALDPQLHTHALLINLTMHADRRNHTTAVDTTYFYHFKMAAGAIYRAALAEQLQKIGFSIKQKLIGASIGFEIDGIPDALVEEFSKRRAEIEEVLKLRAGSLDSASPRYAEMVTLETRRTKNVEKPRAELLEDWKEVGRSYGIDAKYIEALLSRYHEITPEERTKRKNQIFSDALNAISDQVAHFNEADLTKSVAERAAGLLSARDVRELIHNRLHSKELIPLGNLQTEGKNKALKQYVERSEMRFTTPQIRGLERQLIGNVERIVAGVRNETPKQIVESVINNTSRGFVLDKEQATAVRYLMSGPSVRLLVGIAGSGKTTTLKTCLDAWRAEHPDRVIIGTAVAAVAKNRLRDELGGGFPAETLTKLLMVLDNGRLKLDSKSVIMLDEAAMVGTRQLARLVEHIQKAPGARLVLVGDAKQLQAVEAGGAFKYLETLLEKPARLTTIRRQEEVWARDAVTAFEAGNAAGAIQTFFENGHFHLSDTRKDAITHLLERWKLDGGTKDPSKVVLLASTNHEVKEICLKAQAARILEGFVDPEKKIYSNGVFFHVGDRVQFQAATKEHTFVNGDNGTVTAVDPDRNRITVRVDADQKETTINLNRYSGNNLRLGYASTTHKFQGATVEHCHVLMGGPLTNLHMGYVQVSRSKVSTHLFCDIPTAGGPELADLIRSLGQQRQKTMAQEVIDRNQKREPERAIAVNI